MNQNEFYGIVIFLLGLCIGSFMNVCVYRIPDGKSIVYPPSYCPNCGAQIKPWHLIPVLSYMLLRGRCASCRIRISIRYPVIELLNGSVWLLLYMAGGFSIYSLMLMLSCSTAAVFFLILLEKRNRSNQL